jgi:hypothetical protein
MTEFFIEWYEKSEAGKTMLKEAFLFRRTRNGSIIASDRFVEHNVFYVRVYTGKKARGAHHAQTVQVAGLLMNERLTAKSTAEGETKKLPPKYPDAEKGRLQQKVDKVTLEAHLHAHDLRLCGTEEPRCVPAKPHKERCELDPSEWDSAGGESFDGDMCDPTGTTLITNELCLLFCTGRFRFERLFTAFGLEGDRTDPSRKGENAKLTKLNPLAEAAKEVAKNNLDRWVSLDPEFVGEPGIFNLDELRKELNDLNEVLLEHNLQKVTGRTPKSTLVNSVIEARTQIIDEIDKAWLEDRLLRIVDEQEVQARGCSDGVNEEHLLPYLDPKLGEDHEDLAFARHKFTIKVPGHQQSDDPMETDSHGEDDAMSTASSAASVDGYESLLKLLTEMET